MRHPLDWLAGNTSIPRAELRWAAGFAALVMAATCLPYLYGIAITPPGLRYMGFLGNPDESNVYMGWMRQAMEGHWLFRDPFTTEPQPGRFLNVFFLALGLVARALHVEPIWSYHAARLVFGFLLLLTGYVFAARFCRSLLARRLALGLMGLSSGLGWLYALLQPDAQVHPIDFGAHLILPEAITFLSVLVFPLFAASTWLLLITYLLLLRAWDTGSLKALIGACVAALILANIHTYDALGIYSVLVAYLLAKGVSERRMPWREAALAAVVAAVSVWPVVYQYVFFRGDFVFRTKALTLTLTPPGRFVALGYGLPLLLAIPGGAIGLVNRRLIFPVVWVVATWLLIAYAPFSFQRKMIEGMHLPLCVLAAAFVGDYVLARPWRSAAMAAVGLVALTIPSNAFFVRRAGGDLLTNNAEYLWVLMPPHYLTRDEYDAMVWLREHTRPDDAVLCTNLMGSYIPGVAGNTVFVGHWAETIHFGSKLGELADFFTPTTRDQVRIEMARRNHLRYLFYGRWERGAGRFDPNTSSWMTPVYRRGEVTIFRFDLPRS
jgi:hypothetical protein